MAKSGATKSRRALRREGRQAERLAEAAAQKRYERQRLTVFSLVPLTAAVAAGAYFGLGDAQLAGVSILVGGIAFLILGLALLGSAVRPRDRIRSGSIDFGQKR